MLSGSKIPPQSWALSKITISAEKAPVEFPLGERGKWPIQVHFHDQLDLERIKVARIPGTFAPPWSSHVKTTWDGLLAIANVLSILSEVEPIVRARATAGVPLPGKSEYEKTKIKQSRRAAQASAILWLVKRSYAVLADPPRAGKTLPLLAIASLVSSRHTLIVCPALPKFVWCAEIAKWLRKPALVLYGRGGTEAWEVCGTCFGGLDEASDSSACPSCAGAGGHAHSLGRMELKIERHPYEETKMLKKGPKVVTKYAKASPVPPVFACSRHPEFESPKREPCPHCRSEMLALIRRHEFVIANYDILYVHIDTDGRGKVQTRYDLPGWNPTLSQIPWRLAICDEAHRVRVWKTEALSKENHLLRKPNKREALKELLTGTPQVIATTATPTCGFVRDYWGLLDLVSNGLWS